MPRTIALFVAFAVAACSVSPVPVIAQVPTPYSGQLKTDPAVGNVQGIQRIGRAFKTDPDQGSGFSYHVYPVSNSNDIRVAKRYVTTDQQESTEAASAAGEQESAEELPLEGAEARREDSRDERIASAVDRAVREAISAIPPQTNVTVSDSTQIVMPGRAEPFDWTSGIRNYATPGIPLAPRYMTPAQKLQEHLLRAEAIAVTRAKGGGALSETQIYDQPLVQIKMRVVEVARGDGLAASSILEYVSSAGTDNSFTSGNTSNGGNQNFRSLTRYLLEGLVTNASTGTGTLANLTTQHINWLVQTLATENNADVITAPEIVTLNGQNAEFVAGEKLPFELGQNVITGNGQNIQQVFYKHVGTMVSVTPRIVNWGLYGEGRGERSIQSHDIQDWPLLVDQMAKLQSEGMEFLDRTDKNNPVAIDFSEYQGKAAIPFKEQAILLHALNDYSRQDMSFLVTLAEKAVLTPDYCYRCTTWQPSDCTIDLAVVVRLSESGSLALNANITGTTESNVRAISNVIQVKSGFGVVMAGLIGEREIEEINKTPILGDLPVVGSLFRAKTVQRLKTEVLIFIEAEVLHSDPCIARAESYRDFVLGRKYVKGGLLENPLEVGMYRAGIGPYLPAWSKSESVFWEKYHRKLRKMRTHASEILEP